MTELSSERLVEVITELADDKKAIDIVELAVRDAVGYTDYFLICSGNTERQVKAIHDGIHQGLKDDHGMLPRRVEGLTESRWVLMDYLDVVVHVFTPEARDFYRLEQLWGEVPARAVGTGRLVRRREVQVDRLLGRVLRPAGGDDLAARVELHAVRPVDAALAEQR